MRLRRIALALAGASLAMLLLDQTFLRAAEGDIGKLIARLQAVGPEGAGTQEAAAAWKELVGRGIEALFPTLTALGTAEPRAANWLRSAVDAIAEKEKQAGRALPLDRLERYVKDTKNPPP